MANYKLTGVTIKKRIPKLGFIENFKRAYWPVALLVINSETKHLLFDSDKEKINFGVPKKIELENTKTPLFYRFIVITIIFTFYFGFFALGEKFVPTRYWPLYESASGYYVLGIILLIWTIIISGKVEQTVRIVYSDAEIEKEIYLSPSKYLGMENIQFSKSGQSAATIGDTKTYTAGTLYAALQEYYKTGKLPEQNSTQTEQQNQEIEKFLNKRFSWGGLLGPIYWWSHHLNRKALKTFIPVYGNIYVKQLSILRGRRIVWESGVYKGDFPAFKKRQILLDRIGATFLTICLLIVAACIAVIIFVPNKSIGGHYEEKDISGQYLDVAPVENGNVHITGLAFWYSSTFETMVHSSELDIVVPLTGNRIHYELPDSRKGIDPDESVTCAMDFVFNKNKLTVTTKSCILGGSNVSFDGEYEKVKI